MTELSRGCAATNNDPFRGVAHNHTLSDGSAAAASDAGEADDPFSLWGAPPPPKQQARPSRPVADSFASDELLDQWTGAALPQPPPQEQHSAAESGDLLYGFSSDAGAGLTDDVLPGRRCWLATMRKPGAPCDIV